MLKQTHPSKLWFPAVCVLLLAGAAIHAADSQFQLHVRGVVTKPTEWTTASLHDTFAAELKNVEYESRGMKHVARCVSLLDLLKRAGADVEMKMNPNADPKSKNLPLRLAVLITGRDGYAVTFSMAELLADIGKKEAWLAVEVDGMPVADADAPARLIVPSDDKPARWVRGVDTITVIDPVASTTQPSTIK